LLQVPGSATLFQTGTSSWSQVKFLLPSGEWPVQIVPYGDESVVDQVVFTPAAAVPLAEALDAPALTFRTSGAFPWSGAQGTGFGAADNDAAGSSLAGTSGASWLECEVSGPGTLTGKARVAAGVSATASIRVDGARPIVSTLSLTPSYQSFSIPLIGAGLHQIRFGTGQQILWFDQFVFTPQSDTFFDSWAGARGIAVPDIALDSDHDGVPLLAEWAFGLDPTAPDARQASGGTPGLPSGRIVSVNGVDYPAIEYFVRKTAVGLDYFPEFAGDTAGPWLAESVVVAETDLDSTWKRVTARGVLPVSSSPKNFARLRVF
jgi:hypothetical protein